MNTHLDLESELHRLATEHAPSAERIRRDLDQRQERHGRRRRTTAWIAVAASVVVVAGGVGVTASVVEHHRAASAASHGGSDSGGGAVPDGGAVAPDGGAVAPDGGAVVPDDGAAVIPEVDGSTRGDPVAPTSAAPTTSAEPTSSASETSAALVPLSPDTVTSPVTAQAPEGLTGPIWRQDSAALWVKFVDADAARQMRQYGIEHPDADAPPMPVREAGYVVTSDRDGQLHTFGSDDAPAPEVTRRDYPIAGHAATLETAPKGTVGAFATSAIQRLTWQLPDGRWIHVYSAGEGDAADGARLDAEAPSAALRAFAAGITNDPQPLEHGISLGLTVPGLDNVSRSENLSDADQFHSTITACRDGFDPMSAEAQGAMDSPCVMAEVHEDGLSQDSSAQRYPGTVVVSGGLAVHVGNHESGRSWPAWALPADGLVLWVTIPSSAELSNEQFAALVASVRVSPEVLMLASSADSGD